MDLSKGHIRALQEGDLTSPKGIEACINASEALLQCMNVALRPGELLFLRGSDLNLITEPFFFCARPVFAFADHVLLSPVGHEKLMAVTQQQLLFAELRDTFARRLTNHLNNVFVHQVTRTHMYSHGLIAVFNADLKRHFC